MNADIDIQEFYEDGRFVHKRLADEILGVFNVVTTQEDDTIWIYKKGVWRDEGEAALKKFIQLVLGEEASNNRISEVLGHVRRMTYISRRKMNKNPYLLNFKDGMLDVYANPKPEFKEHDPDELCTTQLPIKYDPDAGCPKIKKFISEIVNEDNVPLIQEMIGYCLRKDYRFHKAFMLLGSGANGKSTLLSLLKRFLGKDNVASASLQELCNDRFAKVELYGKLASIHAGLPARKLQTAGAFKMLTGQDTVRAQRKY